MDAGGVAFVGAIAAVLGAAVGAGGAVGAAAVSGRTQRRTQRDQWARQSRQDAYSAFLNAAKKYEAAIVRIHAVLIGGAASGASPEQLASQISTPLDTAEVCQRACEDALGPVQLVGPPAVFGQAMELSSLLMGWQIASTHSPSRQAQLDSVVGYVTSGVMSSDFPDNFDDQMDYMSAKFAWFVDAAQRELNG